MSNAKPQFLSLTHARSQRDKWAKWAIEDIPMSHVPAVVESICRASSGWQKQIQALKVDAEECWIRGGCSGIPSWNWLDDLGLAVQYIYDQEHASITIPS